MRLVSGYWCPDYDANMELNINPPEFAGRFTYQFYAFARVFNSIKDFRHGVDIGAHIGLWSHVMSRCFTKVTAFEAAPEHAECFKKNLPLAEYPNIEFHEVALSDKVQTVSIAMKAPWSLKARVHTNEPLPTVKVQAVPMDSLLITEPIDFIKIDVEGYELFVIKGAEATIKRNKPLMLVEQKPLNVVRYDLGKIDAVTLLESWGAKVLWMSHDDYCLSW